MKISIIIVNYRVKHHVHQCVLSLRKAMTNLEAEIILVDNFSNDGSVAYFQKHLQDVRILPQKVNLGFSKANNLGVKAAKGEYVLILNPDTVVPENCFDELLDFADQQANLGAIGVQLVDGHGQFHPECKRNIPNIRNTFGKFFTSIIFKKSAVSQYYANHIDENDVAEVPVLVGAFMLMKRETYLSYGGFDEAYFMYGEDIDLCATLTNHGLRNFYFGKIKVLHYKGESTKKDKHFLKTFFGAIHIFLKKYYSPKDKFTYWVLKMGTYFRYFLARLILVFTQEKNKIKPPTHSKNIRVEHLPYTLNGSSDLYVLNSEVLRYGQIIDFISENQNQAMFGILNPGIQKIFLKSGMIEADKT